MVKNILLTVICLIFMLSTTASAATLCCWNMEVASVTETHQCHPSNDTDDSQGCCDGMMMCKIQLIHNTSENALGTLTIALETSSIVNPRIISNIHTPPTHPPKKINL